MTGPAKSHGRKSISASLKPQELMRANPKLAGVWTAQIITLFPQCFPGILGESLTGKALKDGKWALETTDLRRFGEGRHKNVDDTPAGGGRSRSMSISEDHVLDISAAAAVGEPGVDAR